MVWWVLVQRRFTSECLCNKPQFWRRTGLRSTRDTPAREPDVRRQRPPRAAGARGAPGRVLAAEVVKFYFPKMVEMHNYVPANSTQQKLSNWSHLNRKVLSKLNFSIPADVIRKIVQCTPGAVELVLIPLRQRIEEKQSKAVSGAHKEPGTRYALDENGHLETGYAAKPKTDAVGISGQQPPHADRMDKGQQVYAQGVQGDPNFGAHLAARGIWSLVPSLALTAPAETRKPHRSELAPAGEAQRLEPRGGLGPCLWQRKTSPARVLPVAQILQMKVRRLEHLLHLKNVRIDDLTRRLQQVEQKRK
nr:sperm flagellar protein 1 [Pelodiscus sinensis]|eukprot:XP_014424045.1 sperm flagellar protein 1 [Pelodiscus sinensis]